MQYYADLDEQGKPIGFYIDEIHGDNIPSTAVPITEDMWKECVNNQGKYIIVDGKLQQAPPPPVDTTPRPPTLEDRLKATEDWILDKMLGGV